MNKSIIWFVPAVCVSMGILLLSTVFAIPIQVEGVSGLDKLEHSFAYMVLTFSFLFAFLKSKKLNVRVMLLVVAFSSLYGLGLEFVQYYFFEYRVFEWLDALANLSGVLLGLLSFKIACRG